MFLESSVIFKRTNNNNTGEGINEGIPCATKKTTKYTSDCTVHIHIYVRVCLREHFIDFLIDFLLIIQSFNNLAKKIKHTNKYEMGNNSSLCSSKNAVRNLDEGE